MGADIRLHNETTMGAEPVADIEVRHAKLKGIEIPQEQVPLAIDEFPVIFIAAACAEGETVLRGAKELRVKETDRIAAMAEGLQTLGVQAKPLEDGIIIQGGKIGGGRVKSYDDHRIAMAFAVAGCVTTEEVIVENCENVQTSLPNFVEVARDIGFSLILE
jgi:3-phosphoshikimate 1-carboxyvinyltransferase